MAKLLLRKTLFFNRFRTLHRSSVAFGVPVSFNMFKNREKFDAVLPEVMDCIMSSSKFTQYNLPEVGNWVKKLNDAALGSGSDCPPARLRAVWRERLSQPRSGHAAIAAVRPLFEEWLDRRHGVLTYRMTQVLTGHGSFGRFLSALVEPMLRGETEWEAVASFCEAVMLVKEEASRMQAYILAVDDIIDASTTRRGKTCWYLQPNVGTSAVNDCALIYQCFMELLDIKFGKEPFYTDLVKFVNESIMYTAIGQYLDHSSGYTKEKNNLDGFTMERFDAIAIQKTGWYSFRLPMLVGLLLVKNGKEKDTTELTSICWEFGKILQFQNDYKDIYWAENASGKAGTDIQEGKLSWISVAALHRCNEAQRAVFKANYGSKDPEHVKRIKQLYGELQIEKVYENFRNSVYKNLESRIRALPNKGEIEFCSEVMEACRTQIY